MNDKITVVDIVNYERAILQSAFSVLIDFWAPWCDPCIFMRTTPFQRNERQRRAGRARLYVTTVPWQSDGAVEDWGNRYPAKWRP